MNAKIPSKMLALMLANRESKSYSKPGEITRKEFENGKASGYRLLWILEEKNLI